MIVNETFILPDPRSCVETRIRSPTSVEVALESYTPYDSGRLFNTQTGRELYVYYKNSNNIITGQALGAGYKFEYAQDLSNSTGIATCYNTSLLTDDVNPDFKKYSLARIPYPIIDGSSLELVEVVQINNSDLVCTTEIPSPAYLYYVVALNENQDLTYIQTLAATDVTAAIIAIVLYTVGIILCKVFVAIDVKRTGRQIKLSYVKPVCVLIAIAFLLRLVYAAYILGDPTNDPVTVLFIELPCLIIWTVASLLVFRWLKRRKKCAFLDFRCCMGSLREYIIFMVLANTGLFIAYLIVLFVLTDGDPVEGSPLNSQQIQVSYVWFTLYENWTIIAFVWFVIAAIGTSLGWMSSEKTKSAVVKRALFVATFAALLVLAGQTSIMIHTFLWVPFPGYGDGTMSQWITQLLICDLIPFPIILYSAHFTPLGDMSFNDQQNDL
jgi:hypothetical protein